MGDALEKLQHKLEAAQRALAAAEGRYLRQEAEHQSAIQDAAKLRKQVERAHQEWISALDAVEDPIFVHDKDFRVLRCNQAYQRSAGTPFKEIIGRLYYEVFPKIHAPLPNCRQAQEKAEAAELLVGDTTYSSRAYTVVDGRGVYLYSVHTLENVNESRRIDRALRESELRYRQLFEAARDGILMLDGDSGKIIDANSFILDLLSYSLSECTAKMLWEVGLFKDVESSKEAFRELQSTGYIRYEDLPLQTKDGRRIEVEFVSTLYEVGERNVIQCNIRDITERMLAKHLLQESELQFRRLFEAAQDGILILNAETGTILDANPFILNLLSYRLDECVGKMLWEIGLFKDIAASKEAFDELQSIGYIRYEDLPLKTKDGRRIDVEFVSNLYEVGERKVIQCNIRDITERKADEASLKMFRALLDKSSDAIEVLDPTSLNFIDVNETACRTLGYSREELLSMSIHDIDPDVSKVQLEAMDEALQSHDAITFETTHRRKDGSTFPAEVSISQARIGREYRITVVRDITERRHAESKLQDSEERLRAIFDGALDGIALVDLETMQFTEANSALCRMLGYSPEEIAQLKVPDIHPPQDWPNVLAQFKKQALGAISLAADLPVKRKDSSVFYADINTAVVKLSGRKFMVGIFRDVTERRQAQKALLQSEEKFRSLVESTNDWIWVIDQNGSYTYSSPQVEKLLGYQPQEVLGKTPFELMQPQEAERVGKVLGRLIGKHSPIVSQENINLHKDGRQVILETSGLPYFDERGEFAGYRGIDRDITKRKHAENQLNIFRTLLDNSSDSIEIIDPVTLRYLDINETAFHELGYSREEMLSMTVMDIDPAFTPELSAVIQKQLRMSGTARFETVHRRKNGSTFPVEVSAKMIELDKPYALNIVRDITERRAAENKLKESEERFRAIFDHARDGIIVMDVDKHAVKFANRSMEQMLGYGPDELAGLTLPRLHPPEALAQVSKQFESDSHGGQSGVQDMPMQTKDGRLLYADLSGSPVDIGGQRYQLGVFRDATDRRASEQSLRRANRALKTLSAGNLALVRATNEEELLQTITEVIVKHGGYVQAAVDYAEDDPEKRLTPKAWAGYEGDHYWAEHLSWADTEQGQLPASKAIRSGKTQVCHGVACDPGFKPWRDIAAVQGYVSNIALPMSDGKRTFAVLSIYSSEANAFDEEEVRLLEEMASDLAYGIVTLRTRKEYEQHTVILRRSLEQSIETIADTVEARDPYTAGHQRRVAELATAIARELGLPDDQVNGIHLAAIVHDLGKIRVPAEILSKPGKLTNIEYMLIKQHPQDGYDILKNVQFPWPIADIILQHHEKLDGSGYPQGLKGDQILRESRILTVADIVEAMSSHRPYRAALGIEPALDEIRHGRGSAYDPTVVDACLKLFAEKAFAFSSQAA